MGCDDPSIPSNRPPRSMMRPLYSVKSTARERSNQLPDRHIARDPRLRSFCVESVPSQMVESPLCDVGCNEW